MRMIDRFKNGEIVVNATKEVFEWLSDNTKIRWYSGESLNKKYPLSKFLAVRRQKLVNTRFVNDRKHVTAEEFLRKVKEEMFTKDMLRTGMVVEYRNGKKCLLVKGKAIGIRGFMNIELLNEKLFDREGDKEWDVIKVYKSHHCWGDGFEDGLKNGELIWERNAKAKNKKIQALKEIGEAKEEIRRAKERIEAAEKCLKECK